MVQCTQKLVSLFSFVISLQLHSHNSNYYATVLHHCLQVLNLNWEVDFGRQFDLNVEESLSLLIDPTKIPHEVKTSPPRQWNPDSIMADFEGDEFLQMMDDINKTAEVAVNA